MISSRRLAREWALKILYQMDVGGASLSEARDSALDRLRTEFVQRGSRNASGSKAELVCLEYITSALSGVLTDVRAPFEKAVNVTVGDVFSSAPCWQEVYFEKSFKYKFKGQKLRPTRLLLEPTTDYSRRAEVDGSVGLTELELSWLRTFARDIAEHLPLLVAPEMRRNARETVSTLYARLPNSPSFWNPTAEQQLLDERMRSNTEASERWLKVAQIVQKQTADWLRVGGFTVRLVTITDQHRTEIDAMLTDLASGWKLSRQAAVDRNILRLAALEMLFVPEIPLSASINEAVELAKKFSAAESGRFVNGVLGAIALKIGDKLIEGDAAAPADDDLIDDVTDSREIVELDAADALVSSLEVPSETH